MREAGRSPAVLSPEERSSPVGLTPEPPPVDWGARARSVPLGLGSLASRLLPGGNQFRDFVRESQGLPTEAPTEGGFLQRALWEIQPEFYGIQKGWIEPFAEPGQAVLNALGEPGVRRRYNELKDRGHGDAFAIQAAYQQAREAGEIPWWQDLLTGIATDPIEWIPGIGIYGAATKAGLQPLARASRVARAAPRIARALGGGAAKTAAKEVVEAAPSKVKPYRQIQEEVASSRRAKEVAAEKTGRSLELTPRETDLDSNLRRDLKISGQGRADKAVNVIDYQRASGFAGNNLLKLGRKVATIPVIGPRLAQQINPRILADGDPLKEFQHIYTAGKDTAETGSVAAVAPLRALGKDVFQIDQEGFVTNLASAPPPGLSTHSADVLADIQTYGRYMTKEQVDFYNMKETIVKNMNDEFARHGIDRSDISSPDPNYMPRVATQHIGDSATQTTKQPNKIGVEKTQEKARYPESAAERTEMFRKNEKGGALYENHPADVLQQYVKDGIEIIYDEDSVAWLKKNYKDQIIDASQSAAKRQDDFMEAFRTNAQTGKWSDTVSRVRDVLVEREDVLLKSRQAYVPGEERLLPTDLKGSKPKWNQRPLKFESDIDRALFIVQKRTKLSARDKDFMKWLRTMFPDMSDSSIFVAARKVRARLQEVMDSRSLDIVDGEEFFPNTGIIPEGYVPPPVRPPVDAAQRVVTLSSNDWAGLSRAEKSLIYQEAPSLRSKAKTFAPDGSVYLGQEMKIGAKFRGYVVPNEVAQALVKMTEDAQEPTGWLKRINGVANASRFLQTGIDPGFLMIQGQMLAMRHPRLFAKAAWQSLNAFIKPENVSRYLAAPDNLAAIQRMERGNAAPLVSSEYVEAVQSGLMKKLPLAEKAGAAFNVFIDASRIELHKAFPDSRIPGAPGSREFLEESRALTNVFDHMVGVSSSRALGVSGQKRFLEGAFLLYAPRYRRAVAALMVDVTQGGVRGEEARKALGALAAGSMFFMAALAIGLGVVSPANRQRAPISIDPTGETPIQFGDWSLFNPAHPNFMRLRIGNTEMGLGGAYISNMRMLARVSTGVADGEFTEPLLQSVRGMVAPATGVGWSLLTHEDYFGDPIYTYPGMSTLVAERLLPFWMAPYVTDGLIDSLDATSDDKDFLDELGKRMPGPARLGAGLAGLRESPAYPRNLVAQDLFQKEWRDIEDPYQKDMVRKIAQENYAEDATEFTKARQEELSKLEELAERDDISVQKRLNEFFKIRNVYRGIREGLERGMGIEFKERKDNTPNEEALESVYDLYDDYDADTYDEEYAKLQEQWSQEMRDFVTRNLNRYRIPEKLFYQLPASVKDNYVESLELRKAHLESIGRQDLINPMEKAYLPSALQTQGIADLRKIHASQIEYVVTDDAIQKYIEQRFPRALHPYIKEYVDGDRDQRNKLMSDLQNRSIYSQVKTAYDLAERDLKRKQVEIINNDIRAGGDLELMLWLHDKHPFESRRRDDPVFLKKYNDWLKERESVEAA